MQEEEKKKQTAGVVGTDVSSVQTDLESQEVSEEVLDITPLIVPEDEGGESGDSSSDGGSGGDGGGGGE